jgi:hypothetical protein
MFAHPVSPYLPITQTLQQALAAQRETRYTHPRPLYSQLKEEETHADAARTN